MNTSYVLVSFLSLPASEQIKFFNQEIPKWRGAPTGPIALLLHAMDRHVGYFFDYFPVDGDQALLDRLKQAQQSIVCMDSLEDFVHSDQWSRMRMLARDMLATANVMPCEIPNPLPLTEWVSHFKGVN